MIKKYKAKELKEMSEKYDIPFSTLKNKQKLGKQAVDAIVIAKIVKDKEVSLEEFLKLFDHSIAKQLEQIREEPYHPLISPLKLSLIEIENENSLFIDDQMFKNRDTIEQIRNKWWKN